MRLVGRVGGRGGVVLAAAAADIVVVWVAQGGREAGEGLGLRSGAVGVVAPVLLLRV